MIALLMILGGVALVLGWRFYRRRGGDSGAHAMHQSPMIHSDFSDSPPAPADSAGDSGGSDGGGGDGGGD